MREVLGSIPTEDKYLIFRSRWIEVTLFQLQIVISRNQFDDLTVNFDEDFTFDKTSHANLPNI